MIITHGLKYLIGCLVGAHPRVRPEAGQARGPVPTKFTDRITPPWTSTHGLKYLIGFLVGAHPCVRPETGQARGPVPTKFTGRITPTCTSRIQVHGKPHRHHDAAFRKAPHFDAEMQRDAEKGLETFWLFSCFSSAYLCASAPLRRVHPCPNTLLGLR